MNTSLFSSIPIKSAGWVSLATVATILSSAGNAQATTLYATGVDYYNNNGTWMHNYRKDTSNALGSASLLTDSVNGYSGNKDFLSLGLGGRAIFDFGQAFSGTTTLWETTWGERTNQSDFDERVDIYYGNFDSGSDWATLAYDLTQWTGAGEILNIEDNAYNTAAGATNESFVPEGIYNRVMLVDKSQTGSGKDGFDVNAIAVQGITQANRPTEVPEPTSIISLLMVGALGVQKIAASQKTTKDQASA